MIFFSAVLYVHVLLFTLCAYMLCYMKLWWTFNYPCMVRFGVAFNSNVNNRRRILQQNKFICNNNL